MKYTVEIGEDEKMNLISRQCKDFKMVVIANGHVEIEKFKKACKNSGLCDIIDNKDIEKTYEIMRCDNGKYEHIECRKNEYLDARPITVWREKYENR